MAELYTAEELIELLDDDFDVSEGEESDFEEDGVFSYLPGASLDVTNHAEPEASHAEPEASHAEPEASPSEAESQSGSDSELAMEEDSVQYYICKLICCIQLH